MWRRALYAAAFSTHFTASCLIFLTTRNPPTSSAARLRPAPARPAAKPEHPVRAASVHGYRIPPAGLAVAAVKRQISAALFEQVTRGLPASLHKRGMPEPDAGRHHAEHSHRRQQTQVPAQGFGEFALHPCHLLSGTRAGQANGRAPPTRHCYTQYGPVQRAKIKFL